MKTEIYQARKRRGWSSAQLNEELHAAAKRLGLKAATPTSLRVEISYWENGHRPPDTTNQLLLQEAFGLSAEALGFEDTAGDALPGSALRSRFDAHKGRQIEISDAVLSYFAQQLRGHARADNVAGPGFVMATADLQLRQLEDLAHHGPREVGLLAARYAEFMGWLLQDSGEDTAALRYTDRAVELAEAAGDLPVTTYNLMRKSCVLTSVREWSRALLVAQKAVNLAERDAPDLLPVCLRQYALVQSYRRDEYAAKTALQRALELTEPEIGTVNELAPYCTTSYVQMEAALCLLALDNPAAAATACDSALERWPAGLVRDQSLCLARLAVARCQLRHVDEACDAAQRAIELVKAAPSARAIHMLRLTTHKLQPFKDTRGVSELTQALANVA